MTQNRIATCLWFDHGRACEAADFYASVFPDSHLEAGHAAPSDSDDGNRATELTIAFTVLGMPFIGLNGGPYFKFNEAVSFQVYTDSQEETDHYWSAIVGNGGTESQCGWCKDKFRLSWQITPRALLAAMSDPDDASAKRATEAMMGMKWIDIAGIERARAGETTDA